MTYPDDQPAENPTRSDLPPAPGGTGLDQSGSAPDPARTSDPYARPAPGFTEKGHVQHTRTSGVWIGLIGTAIFLILLIVFIAQNSRKVSIHFFGWHGQFSLALTILLSAVIGVLLIAIPGTVRILQLRRALRKNKPAR